MTKSENNILNRKVDFLIYLALIYFIVFTIASITPALSVEQNEPEGWWRDDFSDEAGISEKNNVTVSAGDVIAELSCSGANMILLYDGDTIPAGWTCVSCDESDPFYHRLIRGNINYGGTGGNENHTHTITLESISPASACKPDDIYQWSSSCSHTHTIGTVSLDNASNLPSYRTLKVIKYDTGIPSSLPAGVIAIFDASVPSGWTRYSEQDERYVYGSDAAGATGGSNTHNHSFSGLLSPGIGNDGRSDGSTAAPYASRSHTHTIPFNTDPAGNQPPYQTVLLGKKDNEGPIPFKMIAMFDATVAGCEILSKNGGPFYQKFLLPNATYGNAGGNIFHTTQNAEGTTSGPSGTAESTKGGILQEAATGIHTHTVNFSFSQADHTPPYIDVIFAKVLYRSPASLTSTAITPASTPNWDKFYANYSNTPASWWDGSWASKIPITISNKIVDLTDYQVNITIDTSSIISGGKMRNDCRDIRFIDSGGKTQIPHWLESGCNTGATTIWVKVPLLRKNINTTIYMYYGNPGAGPASNGTNTFEFFDDFDSFDAGKWQESHAEGTYSVSGGILTIKAGTGTSKPEALNTKTNFTTPTILRTMANSDTTPSNTMLTFMGFTSSPDEYPETSENDINGFISGHDVDEAIAGDGTASEKETSPFTGAWHRFEIRRSGAATGFYMDNSFITAINKDITGGRYIAFFTKNDRTLELDWVLIRKYASTEPDVTIGTGKDIEPIPFKILRASDNSVLCSGLTGKGDDISLCAAPAPSIKLYAELTPKEAGTIPVLHDWNVSWTPPLPATTGTINGTVRDTAGAAIPNAKIAISDGTNYYENHTNALGEYRINDVNASTYYTAASKDTYSTESVPNILIEPSKTTTLHFTLTSKAITEPSEDAEVHFMLDGQIYLNMGSSSRITVVINNPTDENILVPLHLGSPDETFRNLIRFENSGAISRNDLNVTLKPHEVKYIPTEILAGKTGNFELVIGPDSIYENKYDSKTVTIINRKAGIFAQTPDLRAPSLIIIIALAIIIISKKTPGRKPKKHARRK